ncbi:MAG: DUF1840 domain-containing protein [Pseudomonadales bacterium]|nr:DUF1840 domain-containing protein [Pseudomonadales bacterium]MCP5330368.1 DUF1840 domain-containing protein [Pseudomonadales bacterium]MCP5344019.1 DUF1840 domain-containing protein [Pseudomonadales bacterium]
MLIRFKSDKSGSFIMQESVAIPLLSMMGMSGRHEGAVSEDELRDALQRLEAALGRHTQAPTSTDEGDDEEEREPAIALSVRATPLLEMLRRALAADGYVMWQAD